MIIHIKPEELEPEFANNPWKLAYIYNPGIDYATQTLDCMFENREHCLFKFQNFGFLNDNRFNCYEMSWGKAGIFIEVKNTSVS